MRWVWSSLLSFSSDCVQRLSAEDLAKTKWMKATKSPLTSLHEPIQRFQNAEKRESLAGPLDWENEYVRLVRGEINALTIPKELPRIGWQRLGVRGHTPRP